MSDSGPHIYYDILLFVYEIIVINIDRDVWLNWQGIIGVSQLQILLSRGGSRGVAAAPPPPPKKKKKKENGLTMCFEIPFYIIMHKNKAQIARESMKKPIELPGLFSGPWTHGRSYGGPGGRAPHRFMSIYFFIC